MAKDATKLLYAGDGEISLATVGTTLPTDVSTVLPGAWVGLGFMAEDGVAITGDVSTNEQNAWQSPDPIDIRVSARNITIQGGVLQFNQESFKILFGGGTWSGTTLVTFVTDSSSVPYYKAMVVETTDNAKKSRFCFPKVAVQDTGELNLRRAEAANAAVTFRALNTGTAATMTVLSDVVSLLT